MPLVRLGGDKLLAFKLEWFAGEDVHRRVTRNTPDRPGAIIVKRSETRGELDRFLGREVLLGKAKHKILQRRLANFGDSRVGLRLLQIYIGHFGAQVIREFL